MKLEILNRTADKKATIKKLRREGYIPAILYQHEKEGKPISLLNSAYIANSRHIEPGHLPTTIFTLVDEKGKEHKAIVKEIQYNVVNYGILHIDFEELVPNKSIDVKIPIKLTGEADCIGVKLGGVIRQVIRHVKVRLTPEKPEDLPKNFVLDVQNLGQRQSKRLKDIEMPESVRPLVDLNEVAVAIVKR